jgi:adenine nucleotide transporter 17
MEWRRVIIIPTSIINLTTVMQVVSKNGWTGLYRGLRVALVGTALSQGIYFYLYSTLRQAAVKMNRKGHRLHSQDITVAESLIVAFLAGCGNVLLTNPFWVIVTRMQV